MGFINDMLTKYREAVLYVVWGGFTTLVTWATYAAFVRLGIELNVSNILSWVCGVSFAFVANKWFVFESRSLENATVAKELSMFFGARIFTGVVAWVLFPVLLAVGLNQTLLGTEGLPAKIIVTVIEIVLNWIFSKYMIFRKKTD